MAVTGLHGEAMTMHAQSAHGEGVRMHAATGSAAATHSKPGGSRSARACFFNKTKISTLREYDFACGSNLPTAAVTFTLAAAASCLLDSQQDKMDKLYCSQPATRITNPHVLHLPISFLLFNFIFYLKKRIKILLKKTW
jgi:hypothetical protein